MNEIVKTVSAADAVEMRPRHDETMNEHGPSPGAKRARAVEDTARRGQQMQIDSQG